MGILSHFNQWILGKTLLTIIVFTDYCNSRRKSERVISYGFILKRHWEKLLATIFIGKHQQKLVNNYCLKIKHWKKLFQLFHPSPRWKCYPMKESRARKVITLLPGKTLNVLTKFWMLSYWAIFKYQGCEMEEEPMTSKKPAPF